MNPMINSVAIVVASLLEREHRLEDVLEKYKEYAGGENINFSSSGYESELECAHRNRALAYLLKEAACYPPQASALAEEILNFYIKLCSITANCESLSVMAATLANGGVNPITKARCFSKTICRDILTIMTSCGNYDSSGTFALNVGLPAKSGVAGGLLVVVPGKFGMCTFAPPLDKHGNSARSVHFCKLFSEKFHLHLFNPRENVQEE